MPPVREINTDDGLYIKLSSGLIFYETASQMSTRLSAFNGNLKKRERDYNDWLMAQEPFAKIYNLSDYGQDHDVLGDPDNLPPWRWVASQDVYEIIMWVAVHFYNDSPLSFTVRCQNKETPITGE